MGGGAGVESGDWIWGGGKEGGNEAEMVDAGEGLGKRMTG